MDMGSTQPIGYIDTGLGRRRRRGPGPGPGTCAIYFNSFQCTAAGGRQLSECHNCSSMSKIFNLFAADNSFHPLRRFIAN